MSGTRRFDLPLDPGGIYGMAGVRRGDDTVDLQFAFDNRDLRRRRDVAAIAHDLGQAAMDTRWGCVVPVDANRVDVWCRAVDSVASHDNPFRDPMCRLTLGKECRQGLPLEGGFVARCLRMARLTHSDTL